MIIKDKIIDYVHGFYVLEMLIAVIYMWVTADFKQMGYGGYVFFTVALLCAGFKFNLFPSRSSKNYFFDRFSNPWLNIINWVIQWFGFIYIVYTTGLQSFEKLFSSFSVLYRNGYLTAWGSLAAIIIAILILWPFITAVTIEKSTNPFTTTLQSLEIMGMYFIFMMQSVGAVMVTFGGIPSYLSYTTILSTFLFVVPFGYVNYQTNAFSDLWSSTRHALNNRNLIILFGFLVVIFCIDSAVWLHPITGWHIKLDDFLFSLQSGIGEEVIFRLLIFSMLLWSFKKFKKGILWALIIQAILFGSMHLVNLITTHISVTNALASTIDAAGIGLVFGMLFLISKNILLPMGIHFLWDWLQSSVTGSGNISVSGLEGLMLAGIVCIICIFYTIYLYNKVYFKACLS